MKYQRYFKYVILLCSLFVFFSFLNEKVQKKVIRNKEFDIHFFISLESKKTTQDKFYYWYKSGNINRSFGDSGGELLHLEYIKYYNTNQLAEKGNFNYGLKQGLWRSWHRNGVLKESLKWKYGEKNGDFLSYNDHGEIVISGKFKNNLKIGVWVNLLEKDTTRYKKGKAYKKLTREMKKQVDSIKKQEKENKKETKKRDTSKLKKLFYKGLFKKEKDTLIKS